MRDTKELTFNSQTVCVNGNNAVAVGGMNNKDMVEVLEQQAATSEVLDIISRSPGELQAVFDMIARSAKKLCHARFCAVFKFEDELMHLVASRGISSSGLKTYKQEFPRTPSLETAIGRAILSGKVVHITDVESDGKYASTLVQTVNYRSVVAVPMLHNDQPVGGIAVLRSVAEPFPDNEIELLKTFADQASIAIENTRLFLEIEARNRDLSEALSYQTVTSRVLRLIASSPTDLQPVFDTIARSARVLCNGEFSGVFQFDGELIHLVGHHGLDSEGIKEYKKLLPRPPGRELAIGRAILEGKIVHIQDVQLDREYGLHLLARMSNMRSVVAVPMLREGRPVGGIALWRSLAEPFPGKQIELLKTFADQALIAIEGVRLFRKVNQQLAVIREVFGKYVPEGVAEAIVEGKGSLEPIQTTATVLYSDLENFTGIVEDMPPEKVVQMLNEYFPAVIEPIRRHGGVVNQFQGDAMLVTFNVPVEDPAHADQAVAAAQEILDVVTGRTFAGIPLRTRIGINTGTVIAGNVGSGDRINYTVHGDAVNLAARLEQLNKEYGTLVLVSGNTVSLLNDSYQLKPIGEVTIRGKQKMIELFQLVN
ncbi:GAF domain-containing protein [Gammaproteobacteria bacterium]|nr:GAF domain-containing protein [Gammaproteobacteria bacterium]